MKFTFQRAYRGPLQAVILDWAGATVKWSPCLLEEAKKHGYEPDSTVCSGDVPADRPELWRSLLHAMEMRVYPMEAIVKVD